jgi:poly(3-hydroxybutyrate) depolymerase
MRYIMALAVMTMVFAGIARGQSESIVVDGETRTFIAHAPSGLTNPPLVISMHGAGGTGSQQRSMSGFDKIADREKFVVVYPDGISNRWDLSGAKDLNFIMAIIDTMAARYQIDRNRVYPTGFSMGGMMSYTLACKAANKIAAIGPASGFPMGGLGGCSPSRPVPILHVHGEVDDVVTYSGLAAIISGWVTKNGCPTTPVVTKPYPADNANSKATKSYYGPCKEGSEIILITIAGMGHAYASSVNSYGINASEEFWTFFKTHSLGPVEISQKGSLAPITRPISARYCAGNIHVKSGEVIRSVRVLDIQGKTLFNWKAVGALTSAVAFPVSRSARGMYLLNVEGVQEVSALSIIAP